MDITEEVSSLSPASNAKLNQIGHIFQISIQRLNQFDVFNENNKSSKTLVWVSVIPSLKPALEDSLQS